MQRQKDYENYQDKYEVLQQYYWIFGVCVSVVNQGRVKMTQVRSKVMLVSKQRTLYINHEGGSLKNENVSVTRNISNRFIIKRKLNRFFMQSKTVFFFFASI